MNNSTFQGLERAVSSLCILLLVASSAAAQEQGTAASYSAWNGSATAQTQAPWYSGTATDVVDTAGRVPQQTTRLAHTLLAPPESPGVEVISAPGVHHAEATKPESSEERTAHEQLEKRVKELEEQFAEAAKEEKEAKEKNKASYKLGGRIHLDYWNFLDNDPGIGFLENSDPTAADYGMDPEDRLLFRRVRLELSGDVYQNMLWRIQVDFNNPSLPEYKDVYLGWTNLPGNHTLILGNQKRPLGLDPLDSSRFTVFMERPLVTEAFNEDARRIGACMYGYTDDEALSWQYGLFSLENTTASGRLIGDSLQAGGYGRLVSSPWYDAASDGRGYIHWALAGAVAQPDGDNLPGSSTSNEARFRTRPEGRTDARWLDTGRIAGAEWYEVLAVENIVNLGQFQFTGEYMVNFLQRDNTTAGTGQDLFLHGFYVQAAYFLTGEYMPYSRTSGTLDRVKPYENFFLVDRSGGGVGRGWGAWQIAARYDYLDLTDQDIAGGVEQNYTLGVNWYWNSHSKVQTNLIFGDVRDRRPVNGFDGGDFAILGTRFMCDF
ncbi:MAG: ATPase [Planctomycetales bacterium]|nr:ATPase [Planctomycetales bacterium]